VRTYGQYCPIARGSEIFAERWTPLIIRNLHLGCETFGEILEGAPGLSRTLLTQRLKQLERLGIIEAASKPQGRGHRYQLTDSGHDLFKVCVTLGEWGARWLELAPENLDPFVALWSICNALRRDRLPDRRVVIRFDFTGFRRNERYWLLLEHGETEICKTYPGLDEDLYITAEADSSGTPASSPGPRPSATPASGSTVRHGWYEPSRTGTPAACSPTSSPSQMLPARTEVFCPREKRGRAPGTTWRTADQLARHSDRPRRAEGLANLLTRLNGLHASRQPTTRAYGDQSAKQNYSRCPRPSSWGILHGASPTRRPTATLIRASDRRVGPNKQGQPARTREPRDPSPGRTSNGFRTGHVRTAPIGLASSSRQRLGPGWVGNDVPQNHSHHHQGVGKREVSDMRRSTGRLGICVTVAVGTLLLGAPAAMADSTGNASCMGIEASAISPPGTSEEVPGGAAELSAFIRDLADQLGVTPGAVVAFIARLREGSHDACDEAIEG